MEKKFSPAPWKIEVVNYKNESLAYIIDDVNETVEQSEHNARLIEAAPTLLKLLEEMVNEYSPFMDIPKDYKKLPGWPGDENPRMVVVKKALDLIEKLS